MRVPVPLFFCGSRDSTAIVTASAMTGLPHDPTKSKMRPQGRASHDDDDKGLRLQEGNVGGPATHTVVEAAAHPHRNISRGGLTPPGTASLPVARFPEAPAAEPLDPDEVSPRSDRSLRADAGGLR